jgi:murein DD-endopeptidase MepM/ murein hydrolase activator NlpD
VARIHQLHFFSRRAQFVFAMFATVALFIGGVFATGAHAATVDSDRAQIAQIQRDIAAKGAVVESLVRQANEATVQLDALHSHIRDDEQQLAADDKAESKASAIVRRIAVLAYIGGSSSVSNFQDTSSITQLMSSQHYLHSVNNNWDNAIAQLTAAHDRTSQQHQQLLQQQGDAQRVLDQLNQAKAKANAAIAEETATLTHVRANLTSLIVTQQQQKAAAARLEAEQAIASALAAATATSDAAPTDSGTPVVQPSPPPRIPPPPPQPVSGGGYANPLRSVSGLSPERIDAGVDYSGVGPVYAIGNGRVVNIYAGDWPGGTFIAYQLTDGPARGLFVYTAEDLNPQVSVGSTVTANTVIGEMYGGPNGIEIGWADGSRIPNAMARSAGQSSEGSSSAFGYNFSRFLQALGAPGGVLQSQPVGSLPAGWPQW